MPPLKVLHLGAGNLYGGVERFLATLARERGSCPGMRPGFALAFGDGKIARELAELGTPPAAVFGPVRVSRPWQILAARRRLAELLARERFDVAVCHAPWTLGLCAPAVRAAGLPLAFWMHDAADGRHWTERWARANPPDLALVNSRWTAGGLPALFGRRRGETLARVVLPYSVSPPTSADSARRDETRAELGATRETTVIIQISRMEPWKGQREHLEALSRLREMPGWVCWMVGGAQRREEEVYRDELLALAARLGIAERVRFLGQRGDVSRLLAAADVFCQPNAGPEPFGIVFVEALGAGLPVVTTAWGGALEIVDPTCGRLVPPGDVDALAAALRELIEQPARREELARRGPARARELCDPAMVLGRLKQELRKMTNDE